MRNLLKEVRARLGNLKRAELFMAVRECSQGAVFDEFVAINKISDVETFKAEILELEKESCRKQKRSFFDWINKKWYSFGNY